MPPTQKEQIAALQAQVATLQHDNSALLERIEAGDRLREDTHAMVAEMYGFLMRPQMGHGNKSLVERMAEVTVEIESGKRTADNVLAIAKWLVGIAGAVAMIAAFTKFGQLPKE